MANPEHLEILEQGVEAWNKWRSKNPEEMADLRGAYLGPRYLNSIDLSGADLSGADLSGAHLVGAYLRDADLSGADLNGADLSSADISYADLSKLNLHLADLRGADISGADLSLANLYSADLLGADLRSAVLRGADLSRADLSEANLSEADLSEADLYETNLSEANLDKAVLSETVFGNVDLSNVKGLKAVVHFGPSNIGIGTIYRSQGKIPEVFLRGCGVPDSFITYIPSLVGAVRAIEFYSCFISFSFKDEEFTERLHSRMRDEHLRVWYAPEDIQGGKKTHEQIDQAIRLQDKLLVVLSEHSIHSEWVMTEIRKARKAEIKEGRRKLFPIRLVSFETLRDWECFDADTGKDLAVEVREYFVPDFSNWKDHDSFEKAFANLLRDLKAEDAK